MKYNRLIGEGGGKGERGRLLHSMLYMCQESQHKGLSDKGPSQSIVPPGRTSRQMKEGSRILNTSCVMH